jgi:hypothetical protein
LIVEEGACFAPIPANRSIRDAEHFGGLLDGEVSEEAKLHDPGQTLVQLGEPRECLVQFEDFLDPRLVDPMMFLELEHGGAATSSLRQLSPRVIDEDLPHRAGRDREEVRAVMPRARVRPREAEVRFMDDRGRAECPGLPAAEVTSGDSAKVLVYNGEETLQVFSIAAANSGEEAPDLLGRVHDGSVSGLIRRGEAGGPLWKLPRAREGR